MRQRIVMHPAEQKRQARKRLIKFARKLEWALDQIISALDELDGDPDLEPDLGSVTTGPSQDQRDWAQGVNDNRELDDSDLEDGGDSEPSLGSGAISQGATQERWAQRIRKSLREETDLECDLAQSAGSNPSEDQEATWLRLAVEDDPFDDMEPDEDIDGWDYFIPHQDDQTLWNREPPKM